MSDLGSDAAGSAMSLSTKALEAILRLFERIFEAWRNNPQRELAKMELDTAKNELERAKILEKLNGKTGYVNYQELKKSGLELSPIGIEMTKGEMKAFSELCKRDGIIFSGMTEKDHTGINKEGRKTYELVVPTRDLEGINYIINRLNDEKRIAEIEAQIAQIEAKGDKMTEQDKVDIAHLKEQKETLQRSYCERLNDEMSNSVINQTISGEPSKKLSLDEALNRLTGRHIDKDVVCIVADANDPSKYIKCHGYQDFYNDKPYIKTEYEVYRGAEVVLKTHDGRFDGRPEGYWSEQKAAIQQAGDFSGTFFKFYSVVDYQRWAEETREQNTQELSSMVKDGERNYPVIIKELEMQLDERGCVIKDGVVVNKQTGEPFVITENMSDEERTTVAETTVIGKQIKNYTEIAQAEQELTVAKANVLLANDGTEEKVTAEAELARVQGRYETAIESEKQLITERKEINAVQAEQEVRNELEHGVSRNERGNKDGRTDLIKNKEDRQMTPDGVDKEIQEIRKEKAASENAVVKDTKVLEGKTKPSMSHDDR